MRKAILIAALCAAPAWSQAPGHGQAGHDMAGMDMSHGQHDAAAMGTNRTLPREGGQSAFAAIAEIVAMLEADPHTDWSRVDIDALRDHLVDMDNVTLHARVTPTSVPGGARFDVTGDGAVRDSIRRMTNSHAAMVAGETGVHANVEEIPSGVAMTVTSADPAIAQRIRALGFFGVMTEGVHHQLHHLMMAKGEMHH